MNTDERKKFREMARSMIAVHELAELAEKTGNPGMEPGEFTDIIKDAEMHIDQIRIRSIDNLSVKISRLQNELAGYIEGTHTYFGSNEPLPKLSAKEKKAVQKELKFMESIRLKLIMQRNYLL